MVIFNFIGYFTLVLCDFSLPHCYVTSLVFRFLRFYLCYAIPISLLLYQDSDLVCFPQLLLPATSMHLKCNPSTALKVHRGPCSGVQCHPFVTCLLLILSFRALSFLLCFLFEL
jgi:hypothetical protein